MELEHVLPKISRRVDGEKLVDTCRRFANVLTDRTWDRDDVLTTRVQREVKRVFTFNESIVPGSTLTTERIITVSADFYANKEPMGHDDETGRALFDESYTLSASLREAIRPDELPEWVIKRLVERPLFRKGAVTEEEMGTTLSEVAPQMDDRILYVVDFEKVTEVEYTIDDEGYLDDFAVTCRYTYDDQLVDERTFSWADEMMGEVEDMTVGANGLSEEEIQAFHETFDEVMRRILDDPRADDAEEEPDELDKLTQAEFESTVEMHYRRAFGMIALNAQRFVGMRLK